MPVSGPTIVDVAIVGGGIAGLAAAFGAHRAGRSVVVLEASERVGGKIASAEIAGGTADVGPDAFLARVPWAVELCHELGMADELVAPATGQAWLWTRGRLRALPTGLVLGVPSRWWPLARSRVLSWKGLARAALPALPALPALLTRRGSPEYQVPGDPSVAEAIGGHLGREVVERLVDPLLGGINAGASDRLSLAAAAPTLVGATGSSNLMRALRRQPPAAAGGPIFLAPRDGMTALVGRLVAALPDGAIRTGVSVTSLTRVDDVAGGGLRQAAAVGLWGNAAGSRGAPGSNGASNKLGTSADPAHPSAEKDGWDLGHDVCARRVILATPAWVTAALLRPLAGAVADELDAIKYSSVTLTVLAYRRSDVTLPPGSGMLVPRPDGRLLTAASWYDQKWPGHARPDVVLIRASAGRLGDERVLALDDVTLVERLHAELREAIPSIADAPVDAVVTRWPRAFPQYEPGHQARVEQIMAGRPDGIALVGAAYRGVGMAACIREGLAAGRARE